MLLPSFKPPILSSSVVNSLNKGLLNGLITAHCSHQFFALFCKAALCSLANASHYTVFTVMRKSYFATKENPSHTMSNWGKI